MEIVKAGKWRATLVILIFLSAGYGVSAITNHTSDLYYNNYIANYWVNSTSTKSTNYYVGAQTLHDYIIATAPGGSVNGTAIDVTSIYSTNYSLSGVNLNNRLGGDWGSTDITTTGDVKGTNLNATTEIYRAGTSLTDLLAGVSPSAIKMASPYSYIFFKSGATYYANSTTGGTDYSGADAKTVIQSAIGAISGGTIFVKSGTYSITTSITMKPDIRIVGEGALSRFELDGNVDMFISSGTDNGRMELRSIAMDANGRNYNLVDWDGAYYSTISDCYFYDSISDYIITDSNSYFTKIQNNQFHASNGNVGNAGTAAIHVAGDEMIENNFMSRSGTGYIPYGINLGGGGSRCFSNHPTETGIGIYIDGGNVVLANHLDTTSLSALYVTNGGSGPLIVDNFVDNCGAGNLGTIYVGQRTGTIVTGNLVTTSAGYCVEVAAGANKTLIANNNFAAYATGAINDSGTGTIIGDNIS